MIRLMIILWYLRTGIVSQFNLYQTDKTLMMSTFGYDCLYYELQIFVCTSVCLIPYCLRPEREKQTDDQDKLCYGNKMSFQQLKTNNVMTEDLFWWNAPIEIIELYEKYLISDKLIDENDQYYCNCSIQSQFGKSCQYDMDTDDKYRSFGDLLDISRFGSLKSEEHNEYLTCYTGIQCQTNLLCLDWRQICNGIVDCDHGEDEPFDLCLKMESNECHAEKEFRCQNGMCIPISTAFHYNGICLDRSDKQSSSQYLSDLCLNYPSLDCDVTNHGWKKFSCNNGQYISYEDLTSRTHKRGQTCANDHHLKYLKRLFYVSNENSCWKAMICLTGFDYLYPHLNCSDLNLVKTIDEWCPNEYHFPPNSVVYSFVFFLYDKLHHINWSNSSIPDFICYKHQYCPINTFKTISKNNFECLPLNQTVFSWKNFYEHIIYLFNPCFNTLVSSNEKFYRCNLSNTFISNYRVKDKKKDCYFNEDEQRDIDVCSLKTNDQFQCLTNPNECIQFSSIDDSEYDCLDGSDEYFRQGIKSCVGLDCDFRPWSKRTLAEIYAFHELCDHVVNRHFFPMNSIETDETDCEYWPYSCDSGYTRCDQIWNCPNGKDEITCRELSFNTAIRKALQCKSNEHYCIRLINNSTDLNVSCISMCRTGDGIIDCIGGTDERVTSICLNKYPYDFRRRFLCMNSTDCIRVDQVCDRKIDCPLGDDEHICPWLVQSSSSTFSCNNTLAHSVMRCHLSSVNNQYCRMGEHLWFCDLAVESRMNPGRYPIYEPYPQVDPKLKSITPISPRKCFLSIDTNSKLSLCNLGYRIRSLKTKNTWYCLCPPSYYGDYCQYQAEYLIVSLGIYIAHPIDKSTVFRLILYLFSEDNRILSHEEIVHDLETINHVDSYVVYMMYERVTNLSLHQRSKPKLVRIDSYIIKPTTVHHISSWLFSIPFPFLPVNKFVAEITLRNELVRVLYCKKQCGSHGRCMRYVNMRHVEYCWCGQGWSGDRCQIKSSSDLCTERSCAANAQCVTVNEEKKQMKCICPLGRSGEQCYIKYNPCENIQCQNNGTCLPLGHRDFAFTCACADNSIGTYCEEIQRPSFISIGKSIADLSMIPAIIIIFDSTADNRAIQMTGVLHKNVPVPVTLKITGKQHLRFLRVFHNLSNSFYYLVSIQNPTSSVPPINTSVITKNRCKNVTEIFNQTILYDYSYLKRLKLYHLPCKHDHNLRCFFDEYRMCLCTKDHNSNCHSFNHQHGNCDYCKNDGLCLRQNSFESKWIFTCLCQECSYGSICQFARGSYFITLDMLIGLEIQSDKTSLGQQSTAVHLILIVLIIILSFSLIFNTIGIVVFSTKKVRQVGCDLYLLHLAIVAEIGVVLLFLRFLYMLLVRIYVVDNLLLIRVSCISLEYLLRLATSLFDWLTVCISMERAYTVIKDVHFTRIVAAKTLKISRWIIVFVVLMNILTTLHRPFYLTLADEPGFDDEPQGHPWCVLDFGKTSWSVYEKVINIGHLIIPFILNLLSIITFIWQRIHFELTSTTRKNKASRFAIIKEQLLKYKSILIGTMTVIVLEIPRFILTFTLACIDQTWQKYIYLFGYLVSFLPLAGLVFIYVMPSPKYKRQFKIIGGKLLRLFRVKR